MSAPPELQHPSLAVTDNGLGSAVNLLMRSLPYAVMRFGIMLGAAITGIIWLVVAFGGASWLAAHIAGVFGLIWFIGCIIVVGWIWRALLRYTLHLLECGHVAVLTELIIRGTVSNGQESMLEYGRESSSRGSARSMLCSR